MHVPLSPVQDPGITLKSSSSYMVADGISPFAILQKYSSHPSCFSFFLHFLRLISNLFTNQTFNDKLQLLYIMERMVVTMPFTANDYEKLHQLMNSSPEIRELLQKLLDSQQYTISKISHEVRNPLTLIYSTFLAHRVQSP